MKSYNFHLHVNFHAYYIELTICFLIGQKHTVNFRSQSLWCQFCRLYTNHVKVTGNHVKITGNHIKFAAFLCYLPSVKKQKNMTIFFIQCIIKQFFDSVFVIFRIIKVSVRVIDFILQLWLITPTSTLIVLDITKTSSGNCLKSNSFSRESFAWRLILEQRHKVTQKLPIAFRNHFYDTKHTIHTIHIHHKTKFAVLEVCYLE